MKKFISFITALSVLCCQPFTSAIRAVDISVPETAVTLEQGDSSENFRVYICIDSNSACTNGMLTVKYDPSALSFTEGKPCELMENVLCEINETEPGTVKIAFVSSTPITDTGRIFYLEFTGKKSGITPVEITADEYTYFSEDGEVKLDYSGYTAELPLSVELQNPSLGIHGTEKNSAVIEISENSGLTNGMLTVMYDSSAAKFESADTSDFPGVIAEINEPEPGRIVIAFVSDESITAAGNLVHLNFSATGDSASECELTVEPHEFYELTADGDAREISFSITNGKMNLSGAEITPPADTEDIDYDINSDNSVNTIDFIELTRIIVGLETSVSAEKSDINRDGSVNAEDLAAFRKLLLDR